MTKGKRLAISAATWAVPMALFASAVVLAGASVPFIAVTVPWLALCFAASARSVYRTIPDDGGQ